MKPKGLRVGSISHHDELARMHEKYRSFTLKPKAIESGGGVIVPRSFS